MANVRKVNFVAVGRAVHIGGGFGLCIRPVGIDQSAEVEAELVTPEGQTLTRRVSLGQAVDEAFTRARVTLLAYSSRNGVHPAPELELVALERPDEVVRPVSLSPLPPSQAGAAQTFTGVVLASNPDNTSEFVITDVEAFDILLKHTSDFGNVTPIVGTFYVKDGTRYYRCEAGDFSIDVTKASNASRHGFLLTIPNASPAISRVGAYVITAADTDFTAVITPQQRSV